MEKKMMSEYTCYCTSEQTKKALELGAPMMLFWEDIKENYDMPYCEISPRENELGIMCNYAVIPTAEQMMGWLEEQGIWIHFTKPIQRPQLLSYSIYYLHSLHRCLYVGDEYSSRKEVTLAAIDSALEYLTEKNK